MVLAEYIAQRTKDSASLRLRQEKLAELFIKSGFWINGYASIAVLVAEYCRIGGAALRHNAFKINDTLRSRCVSHTSVVLRLLTRSREEKQQWEKRLRFALNN